MKEIKCLVCDATDRLLGIDGEIYCTTHFDDANYRIRLKIEAEQKGRLELRNEIERLEDKLVAEEAKLIDHLVSSGIVDTIDRELQFHGSPLWITDLSAGVNRVSALQSKLKSLGWTRQWLSTPRVW